MSKFDKNIPYNDLPLLPPKADVETKEILRKTISAGRALAQLNGTLMNLPNPTLFLDTIYLQEAKASSEVENIITTNDELYKSLVAEKKIENTSTKEVLSYKEALWLGLEKLKEKPFITTNLCISIVQCIKQNKSSIRTTPGTTLSNILAETLSEQDPQKTKHYSHYGKLLLSLQKELNLRVIAKKKLREFWEKHSDCEQRLKAWYKEVDKGTWKNLNELKIEYPSARILENNRVCFNIKGNNYRLIVKINFDYQMMWIRFIGTHAEYDKIDVNKI